MAYYRSNVHTFTRYDTNDGVSSIVALSPSSNVLDECNKYSIRISDDNNIKDTSSSSIISSNCNRPIIFGIDISSLSVMLQYVILSLGLLIFMCLYGYCQELITYGWFDRKLSLFSTFLHFLGCIAIADTQRRFLHYNKVDDATVSSSSRNKDKDDVTLSTLQTASPSPSSSSIFIMGHASQSTSLLYYALLVFLKTASQGLGNLCMTRINYPAKVLFKSTTPIITLVVGILWFKKKYPVRDYIVVALLVSGLYVFMNGDMKAAPAGTSFGIFLVTLSTFCGCMVPMVQEHCNEKYGVDVTNSLYVQYLGSAFVSCLICLFTGEMFTGIYFLYEKGSIHTWLVFFAFCTFGFCGANFSTALTFRFGALVNGITNTARRAITLGLSFALFPERNQLGIQHVYGSIIFFIGLIYRVTSKDDRNRKKDDDDDDDDDDDGGGDTGTGGTSGGGNKIGNSISINDIV